MCMTPRELEIAKRINHQVNREIRYMTDREQYGVADFWIHEPASGFGDCEDYALTKFKRLITAGIPRKRMGIYVVWAFFNGYREGHAVLVIDDRWVLDNVTNSIRDIRYINYKVIKILR